MLPIEIWTRIALAAGKDIDEYVFNTLARAIPALGRWTVMDTTRSTASTIINRRLDLMVEFGYEVRFTLDQTCLWAPICSPYIAWLKNGTLHRNDQPAIIGDTDDYTGSVNIRYHRYAWYKAGTVHRVGGPAAERYDNTQEWCLEGHLHRDGGPAYMSCDETVSWYRHGYNCRDDGPSIIHEHGTARWTRNGVFHRDGGLAAIHCGKYLWFYKNGVAMGHTRLFCGPSGA